jgi:hypothetical protein
LHISVQVAGELGPNAYYRVLLTNDKIGSGYDDKTQTFDLLKIGTMNKSSYVYAYNDKLNGSIMSTGPVANEKIIEKTEKTGQFEFDVTLTQEASYFLLGTVDVISEVDNNGVERIAKTYDFAVKVDVQK